MAELGPADLAAYSAAALLLGFAGQRLAAVRANRGDLVQRYACGFAFCMGVALVTRAPGLVAATGPTGIGSGLLLLVGDVMKIGAVSLLVLVALLLQARGSDPLVVRARLRRWSVPATVVPLCLVLLFCGADASHHGGQLMVHGDGRWFLVGYNLLFAGYSVSCLLVLGGVLTHQTRLAAGNLLRTGLRLMTLAAAVGALWSLWALDDAVRLIVHGSQSDSEDTLSNILGALCTGLTVSGATATVWGGTRWGARITAPARWLRARRRYTALEPLWSALHSAVPGIALGEGAGAGRRPALRDAEFALYRRIIEIRDGQLALRPYVHPEVAGWVTQAVGGPPHGALVEAATLAAALEAGRAGRRARDTTAAAACVTQPVPGAGTVDAEADWLIQVTEAFGGAAAVAEVRRRAVAELAGRD
ncbi:hypothetical protein OG500_29540 [Kitasatospora sp. NBC_01250]|uniref:MAB_1171c family putative transporter n=1 Tax=unclassified Kitasatospora TaxID=2633591 RepID=UPI002E139B37|nr:MULTISPECIES: MAB_1171c family putative transporter [unclassified Kitasatospora]WSJ70193.1 hypothetical protein OG294_31105 [Kitasatospora sp. NBC_01302]